MSPLDGSRKLAELLERLDSESQWTRRRAALAIGNLLLEQHLEAGSPEAAFRRQGKAAVKRLQQAVASTDETISVRAAAAASLVKGIVACELPADSAAVAAAQKTLRGASDGPQAAPQLRVAASRAALRLSEHFAVENSADQATAVAFDTAFLHPVRDRCDRADAELAADHERLRQRVQKVLEELAGYRPRTLSEGQEAAKRINQFVAAYGLRLVDDEAPDGATLAFKRIGRANPGVFVLRTGSTTRYGGVALPKLRVRPL